MIVTLTEKNLSRISHCKKYRDDLDFFIFTPETDISYSFERVENKYVLFSNKVKTKSDFYDFVNNDINAMTAMNDIVLSFYIYKIPVIVSNADTKFYVKKYIIPYLHDIYNLDEFKIKNNELNDAALSDAHKKFNSSKFEKTLLSSGYLYNKLSNFKGFKAVTKRNVLKELTFLFKEGGDLLFRRLGMHYKRKIMVILKLYNDAMLR